MSHSKSLLLCPPTYYDIKYEINPWMNTQNPVQKEKAQEQYERLKFAYTNLNIEFEELTPDQSLPDQVFTTDVGHAEKNIFIKANFKFSERKKEADIAESYFKKNNFVIHTLPDGVYFEGGDLIKIEDSYFFGWGKRSSQEAIPPLEKILDTCIFPIELPDEYYYHLDTCFAPISSEVAIAHFGALKSEGVELLKKHFSTLIQTTDIDNQLLACNLISIDGKAVLTQGISNELKDLLNPHVDLISTVPMSEYIKGGGSVHCVSLEIFD